MSVILALKSLLLASPEVTAYTDDRIYDFEIPLDADFSMTQACVVIIPTGGPGGFNQLALSDGRISFRCYAETANLSSQLNDAVYLVLKRMPPTTIEGTFLHWCNPGLSAMFLRDPTLQWPYTVSSWLVRSSDFSVT